MMLFSRPSKPPVANQAPAYGALRVNTSCYGGVIGVGLGTTRVPGNLAWSDDFEAIPHNSGGGGGGGGSGKGGGGGGSDSGGSTTYTYQTALLVGVSQGPISGIGAIWQGKTVSNLAAMAGTLLEGQRGQAPWGYLTSRHPDKAIGYSELGCVGFGPLDLGDSNSLPNLNFEVIGQGPPANLLFSTVAGHVDPQPLDLGTGLFDAPLALIIQQTYDQINAALAQQQTPIWDTHISWCVRQALTAPWGAQFPDSAIGDLTAFSTYCQAHGFFMSVGLNEARAANDLLNDWVTAAGAEFVWSDALLKIVPYGEAEVTGNGVTYTPDPTPVYDLGPSDFVRSSPDDTSALVKVTRKKLADVYNRVKVEYLDRSNAYNVAVAVAEDPAHIATFGLREAPVIKAHQIQTGAVAQLAADLALARHIGVVTEYEFPLGWRHCRLESMDLVTLTDPESDLDHELVRVTEIDEDDSGRLVVKGEEVPDGVAVPRARITFQAGNGFALDVNIDPGDANAPVLLEPPDGLTATGLEVWMAVSGGPQWGGCDVWVSEDGETYARVGRVTNPSRTGALAAPLALGMATDTVNTLAIDLTESRGQLQAADLIDAQALNTLCWVAGDVDGELLAYKDATLVASNRYDLGYLVRGAFGTAITAHAAGARFARIDGTVFKYPFRADQIGKTINIKLASFNVWSGGLQDISQVQPCTYKIRGTALASSLPNVTGLTTAYVAGITQLVWSEVSDFRTVDYEIRQGASAATGQVIGRTPLLQAPTYGDGTYWVAAHYKVPNGGDVYSAIWTSVVVVGSQLVKNVVATYAEAATGWSGSFTNAGLGNGGVELGGAGNILAAGNILTVTDIVEYGGVAPSGCYTIPAGHRIDIGRVAPCSVVITATVRGQSVNDNILAVADFLAVNDVLGAALGPMVDATPQIRLSQDGSAWGVWQDWIPGSYSAMAFDFRVMLSSYDPQVIPVLTGFTFAVDVPDRIEDHQIAVSAAGTVITYPGSAFQGSAGGQGVAPNPQITIVAAQAGDDVILSNVTLAGFTIQVINAGAGVARTINYRSQGY